MGPRYQGLGKARRWSWLHPGWWITALGLPWGRSRGSTYDQTGVSYPCEGAGCPRGSSAQPWWCCPRRPALPYSRLLTTSLGCLHCGCCPCNSSTASLCEDTCYLCHWPRTLPFCLLPGLNHLALSNQQGRTSFSCCAVLLEMVL